MAKEPYVPVEANVLARLQEIPSIPEGDALLEWVEQRIRSDLNPEGDPA
ncbi:MAG TPA: hypothetical protein IAD19_07965 [Candidatus Egerieicola faecale]|jgi:hypothetical protein|uniref:Uncharacterized protein n=1 Tax=Candidatus Egerieicola faecale TaxID=2840774 RepID=A0A9D1IUV1_9FIRM|nr:hypothetical protein [Candidatus Egerieicola faecale]